MAPFTRTPSEPFRIERPGNTPLRFDGWRIAHVDSRDLWSEHQRQARDRWADVSIYRTDSGKWVYAQVGKTSDPNFRERAVVRVCNTPADVYKALTGRETYVTKTALAVLRQAIDNDPALAELAEERI